MSSNVGGTRLRSLPFAKTDQRTPLQRGHALKRTLGVGNSSATKCQRALSPNPPNGSGHREEARDERSRIEAAPPRPAPIPLGTGCDSHAKGILADRGDGDGRDQRADCSRGHAGTDLTQIREAVRWSGGGVDAVGRSGG